MHLPAEDGVAGAGGNVQDLKETAVPVLGDFPAVQAAARWNRFAVQPKLRRRARFLAVEVIGRNGRCRGGISLHVRNVQFIAGFVHGGTVSGSALSSHILHLGRRLCARKFVSSAPARPVCCWVNCWQRPVSTMSSSIVFPRNTFSAVSAPGFWRQGPS